MFICSLQGTLCAGISLDLPLNALVRPSSGEYTASIDALKELIDAASLNVSSEGILNITLAPGASVDADFWSPQTISIMCVFFASAIFCFMRTGSPANSL